MHNKTEKATLRQAQGKQRLKATLLQAQGRQHLKATAVSPANIAFIKYWGWNPSTSSGQAKLEDGADQKLVIPANDSISMNLSNCVTMTTVEFSPDFETDSVHIQFFGQPMQEAQGEQHTKVLAQIDRLRNTAHINYPVKIVSQNSFPADSGIASSASAFSALTLAASSALDLGWETNLKKLSVETRLSGSGSACRSVIDGFAYWQRGTNADSCYAYQLADENHCDLIDIVVIVDTNPKKISSRAGHELANTSPYYQERLAKLPPRIADVKQAILDKNFHLLGELIEQEATSMHTVCMTSNPSIFYLTEKTFEVIEHLKKWRHNGLFGYFTIDAGPNVHVICQKKDAQALTHKLKALPCTLQIIVNNPCQGTKLSKKHLF